MGASLTVVVVVAAYLAALAVLLAFMKGAGGPEGKPALAGPPAGR
jgi:hypothetical protein